MGKKIVFFDFDNTITKKDTLPIFLRYLYPFHIFIFKSLLFFPFYVLFKLKIISNDLAKKILTNIFFRNLSLEIFNKKVEEFNLKILPKLIKDKAIELIDRYNKEGYIIAVVTGNFEEILKLWAKNNKVYLIGTKLEIRNNKFTGNLATENCTSYQKVIRIKEIFNLEEFEEIIAYGDSESDLPMLNLAKKKVYKKL